MPGVERQRNLPPGGLSWGLRFEGPHDPETLIALDLAEALAKAQERASACNCAASVWRDGEKVADVSHRTMAPLDRGAVEDLIAQLNDAGWYVLGGPTPWDRLPEHFTPPAGSND